MPSVFISYVRQDEPTVVKLAHSLNAFGINVWTDKSKIKPGMRWKDAIRRGISEGDFFVACFSDAYLGRDRSYMNEEITLAIEELRQRPTNRAWFIPILLSNCEVPDRMIGPGETLRSIQWVELYADWSKGVGQILSVIDPRMGRKFELLEQIKSESARARINAADQMGAMGELARDMAPNLLDLLQDENFTVRAAAADALGRIGLSTPDIIDALLTVMRKGEFYSSRHAAVALARFGHPALPALIEGLKITHYAVAGHAATAIGMMNDPSATSDLMDLVNRGIENAIHSLGRIGKGAEIAVPLLIGVVEQRKEHDDSAPYVNWGSPRSMAWSAAEALGEIQDIRAVDCLLNMLHDDNARSRRTAADALAKIGDERAIPELEIRQRDEDNDVRNAVKRALECIGKRKSYDVRS